MKTEQYQLKDINMRKGNKMKPKFDKKKCLKCKHHSCGVGYHAKLYKNDKEYDVRVHCNYSASGKTALRRVDNLIIDTRGNDYNHCLLFEEGIPTNRDELIEGNEVE